MFLMHVSLVVTPILARFWSPPNIWLLTLKVSCWNCFFNSFLTEYLQPAVSGNESSANEPKQSRAIKPSEQILHMTHGHLIHLYKPTD